MNDAEKVFEQRSICFGELEVIKRQCVCVCLCECRENPIDSKEETFQWERKCIWDFSKKKIFFFGGNSESRAKRKIESTQELIANTKSDFQHA